MLNLVSVIFLAALQTGPTIGDHFFGHAGGGPDPVDLTIRPVKVPTCHTEEQIRIALAEKEKGELQSCLVPSQSRPATPKPIPSDEATLTVG